MGPLDRLQELLDERGVKYERRSFDSHNHGSVEYVMWRGVGGLEFNAICSISDPDMLFIDNEIISPEDAVDVTVGRETCHNVAPEFIEFRCSACGYNEGSLRGNHDASTWSYCPNCGRKVVE